MYKQLQEQLDTPILRLIESPSYGYFMENHGGSFAYGSRLGTAKYQAPQIFSMTETFRAIWNRIMLWQPKFCGKYHESFGSTTDSFTCTNRKNPCCGHSENSEFFHAMGIGGWIARQIDPEIAHPATVLQHFIRLDDTARSEYGTEELFVEINPLTDTETKAATARINEQEKILYETIVKPYMLKVGRVLAGLN